MARKRPLTPGGRRGRIAGLLLGRRHLLPDFLIVGAARAGTTTLVEHLSAHPGVLGFPRREVHFFDGPRHDLGLGWYRLQMPTAAARTAAIGAGRGPALVGEKSPFYLADPATPARVAADLPDVRIIALVRDPTARALSHWNIRRRRGAEPRTFDAVAAEELALLEAGRVAELEAVREEGFDDVDDDGTDGDGARQGGAGRASRAPAEAQRHGAYLVRGLYARQLERWADALPRERILVVQSERLFADPAAELPRVWAHLGLAPAPLVHAAHRNRRAYRSEPADPETIARVRAFFRPTYAELAPWLGRTPDWP